MAQRDELKSERQRDFACGAFMDGVQIGMQQRDGDRNEPLISRGLELGDERLAIERTNDCALRVQSLVGLDHARVQRLWPDDLEREQVRAGLVPDDQRVGESASRDEQGLGAGALEQRVGRDRRAHLDRGDAVSGKGRVRRRAQDPAHGFNGRVRIGRRGAEELQRDLTPCIILADNVGESPTAIDPEAPGPVQNLTHSSDCLAVSADVRVAIIP